MIKPFNFARISAEPMDSRHRDGGTLIGDGPADALATVHLYRGQASHDQAVAMFTAAPAMLEALRTLQEHAEAMKDTADMYRGWFAKAAGIAADAIAAAEARR